MIPDPNGDRDLRQHVVAFAPRCPNCQVTMSARMIVPSRLGHNLVVYRCSDCGGEANRTVPR